jgi:hypothetical protein
VVERIAKQGQLASAVQEALENKRAFLEEVNLNLRRTP